VECSVTIAVIPTPTSRSSVGSAGSLLSMRHSQRPPRYLPQSSYRRS
jgi:hypothetical protein